ncbi:hypothetical protein ID866_9147 [Astraeus odoratus]|nr:hypothetical protein ID866_9147 [Astraeus odoratus]
MVTPWRELNAHEYVQDRDTDPRPVVG